MGAVAEVTPGQVWRWKRPDGKYRTMLVQYIQLGPGPARFAMGIHPETKKRMVSSWARLAKGLDGAELIHKIDGYVFERRPGSGRL